MQIKRIAVAAVLVAAAVVPSQALGYLRIRSACKSTVSGSCGDGVIYIGPRNHGGPWEGHFTWRWHTAWDPVKREMLATALSSLATGSLSRAS